MDQKTGYFTAHFEEALVYATRLHNGQSRKGSYTPYVAHLLAVTALVIEWGGDEDMAIAALLHDAVEDQGGLDTLEKIRSRFGNRVARIVEGCSDSYEMPKPPWQERKEAYLRRLNKEDFDVRLVSLADKLHNARSILYDLRRDGISSLDRFNGGREGTLWYYLALVDVFQKNETSPRVEEFVLVVGEIERLMRKEL
jgi:GTP pyrophosphokinase